MSKPIILRPGKITQTIESNKGNRVFYIDAWTFHIGPKMLSIKNLNKTEENNLMVLNEIKKCADKDPLTIRVLFSSNTIKINLQHHNITVEVLECHACQAKKQTKRKAIRDDERPSKKIKCEAAKEPSSESDDDKDESSESDDEDESSESDDDESEGILSESDIAPGEIYMGLELELNRNHLPMHPRCSLQYT
jgi:hypothetical protein